VAHRDSARARRHTEHARVIRGQPAELGADLGRCARLDAFGLGGIFQATLGGSTWEWEPDSYVNVTFSMGKDDQVDKGTPNMLTIVARVLDCRSEDAALILNGNVLLLTRVNGVLHKHNRATWWNHYDFANQILPR
jgi:hypothetical protein